MNTNQYPCVKKFKINMIPDCYLIVLFTKFRCGFVIDVSKQYSIMSLRVSNEPRFIGQYSEEWNENSFEPMEEKGN